MSANTDIFTKSWCSKTNQEDHPEVWKRQIEKEKEIASLIYMAV